MRKIKIYWERYSPVYPLLAVILASMAIIALAVVSFIYLEITQITFVFPKLTSLPFYLYIGILSLLLLFVDYKFRRAYKKHHNKKQHLF